MRRPSYRYFDTGYLLTTAMMHWFWRQYVPLRQKLNDPRIDPLMTTRLSGLAPATVFTAQGDILRHEGEDYANAMDNAGVPVLLKQWRGQIHYFTLLDGQVGDARQAVREAGAELAKSFHP